MSGPTNKTMQKRPVKYLATALLVIALVVLGVASYTKGRTRDALIYKDNLDKQVLTVDGVDLTLKDLAFYIAYEEDSVEKLAKTYDSSDTNKYWNLHMDGVFIKVSAKSAIIQMAVHDEIFYRLALEEELLLTEEERQELDSQVEDFWNDLVEYDRQGALGVDKETISTQMEKIAYAQKYQIIIAGMNGHDYGDYDFAREGYTELLEDHKYKIKESVWNRIPIGDVTLVH